MWRRSGVRHRAAAGTAGRLVAAPRAKAMPVSSSWTARETTNAVTSAEPIAVGLTSTTSAPTTSSWAATTYGVLPKSRPTITLRIHGHRRVIRPLFGVYVRHSGHGRGNPSTVVIKSVH